jgi:hypothetical protein
MVLVYKIKENIREANKENSNSLQKIEFILEKEKSLGILSIDPRSSYTNDKYKHIFKNTYDELVFSGLTLYNTINKEKYDDLREIFMSTIIRLIKNNKPIKILLLKSTQEEVAKRRREFTEFVEKTCEKLRSEKVTDRQIKERFLIKESEYLPYYIVKNENILHIGHYTFEKFSENSQSKMCIFDVNEECDYGKYYYGDFKKFFEDSAYFTPEYNNIVKAKDE